MPLPFNKKLDLKLLDLVKENPILYNTKHPKYLDFDSREVVWQKIGDALNRPAAEFAGIQCQIHFEDFQEEKHKPGFIENLNEYLPETYANSWGIEKKVLKAYRKHQGQSSLEAKNLYIKTARDLPTYGVTFFVVKEKQKDKKKLVPRLLGINAEAILRLDEITKEILQQWPLTHVKTYHVGKSETFTLNFGDYSDKEYCCKTQDAHRIRDILEGYIDIIRRRMFAKPYGTPGDSMAICHDNIQSGQGQVIQLVSNQPSKLVKETFVGPTRIVPFDMGSSAQQGTQMMTLQQVIQSNQMSNPQKALKGEIAMRGDLSLDCVRKLKRMNSASVKIVTLLTDPTEMNVKDTQKMVANMQEDLVVVEMGVKATAQQQTVEESKKMLLDEMQDLVNYVNKLSATTRPGHVDASEAKDAAEKIVDLTTEMYFSHDPKTKRRSEILNRSKNSIIAGERRDALIRRESFVAACAGASAGVDSAAATLTQAYKGPALDEEQARRLNSALRDRVGKLNAALALYLTAHSDPNNVDYPAAINSMNTINELMPKLARDAQMLASTKDPAARKEMLDDMQALCKLTKILCSLTGTEDHEKMQEASTNYADVAGKLIFTFARGKNAEKENEIIELAKQAGDKTSLLLMSANELTCQTPVDPAAADVDSAGVRSAGAARDLLACAQLTAPAIYEPHCQSALTAAAEGLSSSVHHLSSAWKPLVEDPTRQHLGDQLHQREMDVHKALEKLKDAYVNLNGAEDESIPLQERKRLKFVCSLSGAKKHLEGLEMETKSGTGPVWELRQKEATRLAPTQLAQLNAALAALAQATADRNNPDYGTAELALTTISELMPQIAKNVGVMSAGKDEATRQAMQQHFATLCEANREMFANIEHLDGLGEAANKFSAASSKLVFLISPGADKAKEKKIKELSAEAYDDTSALLSHVFGLKKQLDGDTAADLDVKGTRAEANARALITVAQMTAPSIDDPRCASALASVVEQLRGSTNEVTAACHQHLKPGSQEYQELQDSNQQLKKSLDKLLQFCNVEQNGDSSSSSSQQEKKRLQFIKSMADAKERLDAAEQQMKEPLSCTMMREEDAVALQRHLSERVAQLNAAVAALARATADRENPDYLVAQQAVDAITALMPQVVQDACVVSSTKSGDAQRSMLHQVQQLCDASRAICDNVGQPQGLNEAAAKFSDATSKLLFTMSPAVRTDTGREKEIVDLAAASCVQASALLSQVEVLSQKLPGDAGVELDTRGARTADAAQALLTTAQVTAPTIATPDCSEALVSAAEYLRGSAKELTAGCHVHLTPGQQEHKQLQDSQQQLEQSLDRLVQACQGIPAGASCVLSPEQQKQRLQFTNTLSGARSCFDDAQQQLKQPVVCALMRESDGVDLQHQLSERLTQLNAAIAALTVATADREHPDYATAERAVSTISSLLPLLVRDARTLSGTKDGATQQSLLRQVEHLCDTSRAICDNVGQAQGVGEAASKFSDASSKLMFTISRAPNQEKEKQIIDLSAASCVHASELLSQVQSLTQQVGGDVAGELDARGARTADAAQTLVAVGQVTAHSISSPECQKSLRTAVHTLRGSAADLTTACSPHLNSAAHQQLAHTHHQLDDSLDKLLEACKHDSPVVLFPEQQQKQRLLFINSLSGAKSYFDNVQQQLKQPVVKTVMKESDEGVLQHQLSDRVAQLNAAVAALAAATADREHPDYASAQRAVTTITTLMPLLVRDARTLSGTKDGPAQQSLLRQVEHLCDASRAICDTVGQAQGVSEAAAKFSDASSKLMFTISRAPNQEKEKQIIDLSAASCVHASELLSQVQSLTQQVGGDVAGELDARGARTADAAQALLTVAQVTAPSISSPQCQKSLRAAVHTLRGSAADLTTACSPHLNSAAQQQLAYTHHQLDDSLEKLLEACKHDAPVVLSPEQQQKQRLLFINSLSGAKTCFDNVQQQLKQPVVKTMMKESDEVVLQHQLSDRVAQLNAAVAALAAATADREHPDYASAQRVVTTITTLMPLLVRDARTLSGTKDGPAQQSLLRQAEHLCDASRAICDNVGQAQGVSEAAAKFSDASSKLMFTISRAPNQEKEKQIIDLSAASCVHASELLSQVQSLTQQVGGDVAGELDARGARTADAAQALLTVAQVTAPSISSPECQKSLRTAVHTLRGSAADLTTACSPHLSSAAQQQLAHTHHQLDDSLDKLLEACKHDSPEQQQKQRLLFINSLSGAKSCFDNVQQQLQQPVVKTVMKESDEGVLQHQWSDRVAQLNAAVAALAAATADREHPDYASAQRAVNTITTLMPLLVRDARTLSGTKDGPAQQSLLRQVEHLCAASRDMCDTVGQAQIINLSADSFERASELLSQVQALTQQLDGRAATDLDKQGAKTADAAQALLTVAQVKASSISSPEYHKSLRTAVHSLRGSAADLTTACSPHLSSAAQQQLAHTHLQLDDSLDVLLQACQDDAPVVLSPEQQQKQRLLFINSLSGAKSCFDNVQQQLQQPVVQGQHRHEEVVTLQRHLSERVAQLNAAVAALARATANREHTDYSTAQRAVSTITTLMPFIVKDAKTLSGTKKGAAQKNLIEQVEKLCDASRIICDNAGQTQGFSEAAVKFSDASGQLMSTVNSGADHGKEKQIIDLSAASCVHASELLSQVQSLTQQVGGDVAGELDARGARTADAAQALLTVAQVTASSMTSPECQNSLRTAVHTLRGSAADLTTACSPHLSSAAQQQLAHTHHQLDDSLDKLLEACRAHSVAGALAPVQQEQLRVKFIRSVSTASSHLDDAEKQLQEPLVCSSVKQPDSSALQHRLRRRLGQLNAAIAALTAATSDYKNPDYPTAERSIITITELMPTVVQESKTLSCSKDDGCQKLIQKNLKELCDASRRICDNADDPKRLNEAAAKFANVSGKLVDLVGSEETVDKASHTQGVKGKGPAVPQRSGQKPAVPVRSTKVVAQAVPSRNSIVTEDFLNTLRCEESHDYAARVVAAETKCLLSARAEEDKHVYQKYSEVVDTAEDEIKRAEDSLQLLNKAKHVSTPSVDAAEFAAREQNMEDILAKAGIDVAALVSANYADKIDYKAALEPTKSLTMALRSVVDDGSVISSTLPSDARKAFLADMLGLCAATKDICHAAKNDKEKLNNAAVSFGNQSAKLLRVVSADVRPAVEKEVISRAKCIGDCASRLASEASHVAGAEGEQRAHAQTLCGAGATCVDAAGKLVYTAKLVAPTIHHATCQEALISSADTLSTNLATFSETWKPLPSNTHTEKLTEEANHLKDLVDKLKTDVKSGRLGRRRDGDRLTILDTPLRQMTVQIMDNAKNMAEHGDLQADVKHEYKNYCGRLAEALRALDLANARCQRAPHDKNRRNEMDIAIQDLQMMALQTRPARAGQQQNNIVDFRDFLQALVMECDSLQKTADKNQAATGKRVTDDIKLLSTKISEDAVKLMDPTHHVGYDSFDDIAEIEEFGQECDLLVKELNSNIRSIPDRKARNALQAKLLPLIENCYLLRFATNSALSTAKSAAFDAALQDFDDFESKVINPLVNQYKEKAKNKDYISSMQSETLSNRAQLSLLQATSRAVGGEPQGLRRAVTYYSMAAVADAKPDSFDSVLHNLIATAESAKTLTEVSSVRTANWVKHDAHERTDGIMKEMNQVRLLFLKKPQVQVLKDEDTDRLLTCPQHHIEGTRSQLEEKFHQLSTRLSSMSGSIFLSVKKPESLARSLHSTADSAAQLANVARSLKDEKKPVQSKKIDEAAHEMCLATYSLMKTSEIVCQNPHHHDTRRRLLEACHHLNDAINKLNRAIHPEPKISRECNDLLRNLQLQRSALQSAPQPAAASPYVHCIDALQSQRDVLLKLNSDQAMSREEFLKSMLFVTTAVGNSTECAAHAAYLITVSEQDKDVALEGLVDVPKMHKSIAAIQDTCVSIIMDPGQQVIEEKKILEKQVEELLKDLDDSVQKTKDKDLKLMLGKCRKDVAFSAKSLYNVVNEKKPANVITSLALSLEADVRRVSAVLEHPALVPLATDMTPRTQGLYDDVIKHSTVLVSNTQELIKEIKLSPEQSEVLKWSSFTKRREVLLAFEALLKSIKLSGQEASILEADVDEGQSKSYVQIQTDTAFKWLHKPMAKSDVKTNGQQAVRNLIDVGKKMSEDLSGADKEDMRHLVEETEQLLTHCCKKYDQEQYSLLMERIRELQKAIERMAVTRVVEDFMDAEEPLADLDILADAERDEKTRKFLLERKIAELLAQLGRISRTARFIADTGNGGAKVSTELKTCSEQTELLAPMLVKAAEERIHKPDDKAIIENYKALLAKYTESLSKVRDLCDQSVDPMDFVQTAGETMQRMREESTKHNDPMKCAMTSSAITKLANRVIHVGLSSSTARSDPELQEALSQAQKQLSAATPAPDTRASKMPDWKDTTAKILRATEEVESVLGGENIFKKQPDTNQPIYNEALNLHVAIRDWSSRDNEIVAVAKRMAVLMAKLSDYMRTDKQHEVLTTSKSIVAESHEVARLAKKLAHECSDTRIKTNLLQVCERIPTISGQLKMLTTVKGSSLGHHGTQEDKEAMDMLVGNAQSLMISIQDVVKAAASASVKIMSQRGPKIKWVRKTYY